MPDWQWREYHQRLVRADPQTLWQACLSAPTSALRLTRPLMVLRGLGQMMPRNAPIIESMPPRPIAKVEGRELLLGLIFPTAGKLSETAQPDSVAMLNAARETGLIRQVVNLHLHPAPGGTILSTETRAIANDETARRRFACYWFFIRPASGLIRRDTLRAISRLAESAA
ncbi:MAG: hypothetical protein ACK5LJ_08725 [Paracoccus sp. (in: a-proteobacteria)]